ncbi:uncharacterized protein LOC111709840 [Eurytemora carolleeae]|uniref:uncharacterized protein LOC111709840 n=1 Tax=Eurytemora carolleeae TaxID=1294199 RepID=UPI000C76C19A|nr:uncharacterized protein LOC111709840 [Eurytemora carolleeae]|eukprot:XP_023339525.1 uncharacterized protein LOC111709840 [Eurytemora affinis]
MLPSDSTNPAVQRMDQLAREFNLTFPFHLPANSKDERNSSNLIWVVLFSMLFILSFLSNISLILAVLSNSRKRTGVHLIICLLFLVNLVDYGLLILEFSTGVSSHFPWGEESCAVYQYFLQSNPLYYSALLVLLVYHASKPAGGLNTVWWNLVLLVILVLLVSLPTILYSDTAVYPSGARLVLFSLPTILYSDTAVYPSEARLVLFSLPTILYSDTAVYPSGERLVLFSLPTILYSDTAVYPSEARLVLFSLPTILYSDTVVYPSGARLVLVSLPTILYSDTLQSILAEQG